MVGHSETRVDGTTTGGWRIDHQTEPDESCISSAISSPEIHRSAWYRRHGAAGQSAGARVREDRVDNQVVLPCALAIVEGRATSDEA
jgi:hypothetical protein